MNNDLPMEDFNLPQVLLLNLDDTKIIHKDEYQLYIFNKKMLFLEDEYKKIEEKEKNV